MFADALPHPTYCADWYMIGWPASWIVPLALSASLVTLFLFVARRGRPWQSVATLVGCVVLFVLVDYVVYEIGCNFQNLWWTERRPQRPLDLERTENPSVTPQD